MMCQYICIPLDLVDLMGAIFSTSYRHYLSDNANMLPRLFQVLLQLTSIVFAMQIALKLVPDNKTFTNLLMGKDDNYETLKEDMQTLISLLMPFLEEIHTILVRLSSCLLTL